MKIKQSQVLEGVEQLKVLIQSGILIEEITEKTTRMFIYRVEDFYVETKYTLEKDDLVSIISINMNENRIFNFQPFRLRNCILK